MRVNLVTDEDFERLRESLAVKAMREKNIGPRNGSASIDDMHRAFNYVVVRWYQGIQKRDKL